MFMIVNINLSRLTMLAGPYSEVQEVFEVPGGLHHHKRLNTYCPSLYVWLDSQQE
jgi:hypothetical protein